MKIIKWPILYVVVQFGILLIWAMFFNINHEMTSFNEFLSKNYIYLVLTMGLVFIPLLSKNYKHKDSSLKLKPTIICIVVGISLSIIYNTIIYYLNSLCHFTNLYDGNINILSSIVGTVLIGPVIEELIFRGLIYNELKEKYPVMKSILITTILFAIMHANIVQVIYTFAMGFIFIYVYEKTNNLKSSILLHMASNLTTTFISLLLRGGNFIICMSLFVLSLIILIIVYTKSIPFLKEMNVGIFKSKKK